MSSLLRLTTLCLLGWSVTVVTVGQGQTNGIRYTASQLNCARFLENAESSIETETGGRVREQTSGRKGVWQFRASPAVDEIQVEGWLDSLSLWRKSQETTIRPDTDGLLGGRYRGRLSATGVYRSRVRPFVPDEVAEVAGMGNALDDFFPPLPSGPIRPGQAWRDSSGVTLRRMADSGLSGVPLYRYELDVQRVASSAPIRGDSTPLPLRQVSREHGTFVWHPTLGLLRRERRIVVETTVPASRTVRQPVRSKVEQQITVLRDLTIPPADTSGCPATPS
jgi:hypothetical protein